MRRSIRSRPQPSGPAVFEHAHQALEGRRLTDDDVGTEREVERRELELAAEKLAVVLEQDLALLARQAADPDPTALLRS